MDTLNIIENYESLSGITGQMRNAAMNSDWDNLLSLERQCTLQVASMKTADTVAKMDEPARQRKIQLIKKILADDAEIRKHTEVWMKQLQNIMQSNRQEHRLHQTYGA